MMNDAWYEIVPADQRLTQGDLIFDCPLLSWNKSFEQAETDVDSVRKAVLVFRADVVVMTRACDDIVNGYVRNQCFLNSFPAASPALELRVVDFLELYTLPRAFACCHLIVSISRRRLRGFSCASVYRSP